MIDLKKSRKIRKLKSVLKRTVELKRTHFPALEKSVFIVTYGRSGSTLVQNLVNGLPGALVRGENDNLLAPLARSWGMLRHSEQAAKMHSEGKVSTPQDPWFGFEDISPDAFGASLARGFTETVLRPRADTRITGFKEIRWHTDPLLFAEMMDFLHAFFPCPRIIINTRDHDQVVKSGWWKRYSEGGVRAQLRAAEKQYLDYAAQHPGSCLHMHYNDYVQGVEQWRPLFDFLEEPFDPELVSAVLGNKLDHLTSKWS